MISRFFHKQVSKYLCKANKHKWLYYTWGNALVDNLDGTFGFYDIPSRTCLRCKLNERRLKIDWQEVRNEFAVTDLV